VSSEISRKGVSGSRIKVERVVVDVVVEELEVGNVGERYSVSIIGNYIIFQR